MKLIVNITITTEFATTKENSIKTALIKNDLRRSIVIRSLS